VRVNGRKVNIPSYLVKVGDEVSIKDKMHQNAMVMEARNVAQSQNTVPWLELNREEFQGPKWWPCRSAKTCRPRHSTSN